MTRDGTTGTGTLDLRFRGRAVRVSAPGEVLRQLAPLVEGFAASGPPEIAARGEASDPVERIEADEVPVPELEWRVARALLPVASAPGVTPLHASGVVASQGAILIVGPSGSGKSTLAWHLQRLGLPLLGDDTVLLEADGRLSSFPRCPKVDRRALAVEGIAPTDPSILGGDETEAWVRPSAGFAREAAPIAWIVVPRWSPGAPNFFRNLGAGERVERLLPAVHGEGPARPGVRTVLDRLSVPPAIELTFGDGPAAARTLLDRLQRPDGRTTLY